MTQTIEETLALQQYIRITSNVPYVTLFVKYGENTASAVNLVDFRKERALTVEQFTTFCARARDFIRNKGYETMDFLSIVTTSSIMEARKFATSGEDCWLVDMIDGRLIVYDNQPKDFDGLKKLLDDRLMPADQTGLYEASRVNTSLFEEKKKIVNIPEPVPEESSRSTDVKSDRFIDHLTPINTAIVLINTLVFAIFTVVGSTEDVDYLIRHGAMYVPAIIERGQVYRLFTCMFLHFGFQHLSSNMIVLLFLGDNVERAVGKVKYLLIYILGGLIGSIGSFLYALVYNRGIVSVGASGAIFALIGALLCLVIKNKGRLEELTIFRMCIMIIYALYSGFTSQNIDMAAHLFGLFGGFLVALCVYRNPHR